MSWRCRMTVMVCAAIGVLSLTSCSTGDTHASAVETSCQDLDRSELRSLDEYMAKRKAVEDEAQNWPEFVTYRDKVLANGGTPLKDSVFQRKRHKRLLPIMIEWRDLQISVWKTNQLAVKGLFCRNTG